MNPLSRRLLSMSGACILFSLPALSHAGTELDLTLSKAVEMALKQNLDIAVESYNPQIEAARVRTEGGAFDPTWDLSFIHDESADRFPPLVSQTENISTGLNGHTPWGLNYNLNIGGQYLWDSASGGGWSVNPGVDIRQPLLRGFGTDVNLANLRIARRSKEQSEWALRQQVVDTVANVQSAYNRLYQSIQNHEVASRFQELAVVLLHDNETRVKIGVMAPLDVTQARAQVAQRQETVILTSGAVQDNELRLKQLVMGDLQTLLDTKVKIAAPPKANVGKLDVRQGIQDAFEWRSDYRQALLGLEKQHIQVVFEKNQVLPKFDLVASLNLLGLDRTASESLSRAINNGDQQAWTLGAQFSLPIPNRSALGRYSMAKLERVKALAAFKRLEQQIIVDVDTAARAIRTSAERITATKESSVLALESLKAAEERLKAGSGTTFEVLELQRKLAEAEASEVSARADYNRAVTEYDRTTGTILQRNGIEMRDVVVAAPDSKQTPIPMRKTKPAQSSNPKPQPSRTKPKR